MEQIKTKIQNKDFERIKDVVYMYDTNAEVYLFGPGVEKEGQWVDVYVNSLKIDSRVKRMILETIVSECQINIDLVCVLRDDKSWKNMKAIGVKI